MIEILNKCGTLVDNYGNHKSISMVVGYLLRNKYQPNT